MRSRTRRRSDLELRLAGPAPADAAARGARARSSRCASRGSVYLQLRELDLQLAVPASSRAARRCRGSAACGRSRAGRARSARLRACVGDQSSSKITRSTSRLEGADHEVLELARCRSACAGRAAARFCTSTSTTSTPAERASSRSSSSCSRRSSARPRPAVTTTRIARSPRADLARRRRGARARPRARGSSRGSRARAARAASGRGAGSPAPSPFAGRSAATCAQPGQAVVLDRDGATIASRRSFARSVRSSCVSGSAPESACAGSAGRAAGRAGAHAAPVGQLDEPRGRRTITCVTAPRRSTSTPTCAPDLAGELGQLPRELVRDEPVGRERAPAEALEPRTWLAFRPWVLPKTRMVAPCPCVRGSARASAERGRRDATEPAVPHGESAQPLAASRALPCARADRGSLARRPAAPKRRVDGALPRVELAVVVLAAGQGTRMKSRRAKVLHAIARPADARLPARGGRGSAPGAARRRDRTRRRAGRGGRSRAAPSSWSRREQRGTGHAVLQARARARAASAATC